VSALTPEQLAQARADLQRWRDIPAPDPHVIAEGRLMVETRATAEGVRFWIGAEQDPWGLEQFGGVLPAQLAEAIGRALVAKADVARAIAATKDQTEMDLK
jgi:hypothetical protein